MTGARARAVTAALVLAITGAACAELFDDASQCRTDRDCERFAAVCDVARGVCVPPGALADAGSDSFVEPGDSAPDSPPAERCDLPNKPTEAIVSTGLDAGMEAGLGGEITGAVTLSCTKDWTLRGRVFVNAGATLTIQAGTTIRAEPGTDAALVVRPGGRLVAAGTAEAPVVITSGAATPVAGDWQGVVVLGVAPTVGGSPYVGDPELVFGGVNQEDDSGTLRFLRIEYGALGLVLGGVGRRTTVDGVEVRQTTDNCFTFAGGSVDAKHLVCQFPEDDMLELANGYAGRIQFFFGQKTALNGIVGAHGLLADRSAATVYNATLCGDSQPALGYGLVPRNRSSLDLGNAILQGWYGGVDTVGLQDAGVELRGSIAFANAGNPAYAESPAELDAASPLFDDDTGFDEIAWFEEAARSNAATDPMLAACFDATSPQPWPPAAITAGARTPPTSADGFFDTGAAFVGAFRDANDPWMRGWTRFADK